MPIVTNLERTQTGWTATVDGVAVYLYDGRAYWMREAFTGTPLTTDQQNALDHAAMRELYG